MFWLTLTLALQAAGQHGPGESLPPTATTLRTATVQQLVDEYRRAKPTLRSLKRHGALPPAWGPSSWLPASLRCAAALLAAAVRDFSTDPVIALLSGSIAESEGRRNDAAALLRRALAGDPSLVEARLRLGRVLVAAGQTTNGRRELDRALEDARASGESFSHHFALRSLADLDTRGRRTASAAARAAAAAAIPPFDEATQAVVCSTDAWIVYRAAQYWRVARMLTAFRGVVGLSRD